MAHKTTNLKGGILFLAAGPPRLIFGRPPAPTAPQSRIQSSLSRIFHFRSLLTVESPVASLKKFTSLLLLLHIPTWKLEKCKNTKKQSWQRKPIPREPFQAATCCTLALPHSAPSALPLGPLVLHQCSLLLIHAPHAPLPRCSLNASPCSRSAPACNPGAYARHPKGNAKCT